MLFQKSLCNSVLSNHVLSILTQILTFENRFDKTLTKQKNIHFETHPYTIRGIETIRPQIPVLTRGRH